MVPRLVCLSPYSLETVRERLVPGRDVAIELVPPPPAPEAVRAAVAGADLVVTDQRHRHRLDVETLAGMAGCRLVQVPAVGFDTVDHRAAAGLGIPVANAAGYNRDAVADWTVMAMLNLVRQGAYGDRMLRAGDWAYPRMRGRELGALTVGVVGLGNTGGTVAGRLRGFGCRLIFADIIPRSFAGATQMPFERLLEEADIVSVHVPLDADTRGLLGAAEMARMKPGALLVNASRGPVVVEQALVEALRSGHLGGAGLDVYEREPLPAESELIGFENVFLSPHIGGLSDQAEARLFQLCAANLGRALDGLEPFNIVNGVTGAARPAAPAPGGRA